MPNKSLNLYKVMEKSGNKKIDNFFLFLLTIKSNWLAKTKMITSCGTSYACKNKMYGNNSTNV